jgi:hypothetical protein
MLFVILLRYYKRNMIARVYFYDDKILLRYIFGNVKELFYEDIRGIVKEREGFMPVYIYVFKMKKHSPIKKAYFHCSDDDRILLSEFLKEQRLKIVDER